MNIDHTTFNQLTALFTPHFQTLDQRRTLVGGAFFGTDVLAKVQLEGAPDEFTTRTVQMLIQHGEVEPGTPAIIHLMQQLHVTVGVDKQAEIDALIEQVREELARPAPGRSSGRRIFISYARADGNGYAKELREKLSREGFEVWRDIEDMEIGENWEPQLLNNIENSSAIVLVLTPAVFKPTSMVRREWNHAREKGIRIFPIAFSDIYQQTNVPRWVSKKDAVIVSSDVVGSTEKWQSFIRQLRNPKQPNRIPNMVKTLPAEHVERPILHKAIRGSLLADNGVDPRHADTKTKSHIVALLGEGGFGKTIQAEAIGLDKDIIEAFTGGVLFATVGQDASNLTDQWSNMLEALTGEKASTSDPIRDLKLRLQGDDFLIILDDVWDDTHIQPILNIPQCTYLITTRETKVSSIIADTSCIHKIGEMLPGEARDVLLNYIPANKRPQPTDPIMDDLQHFVKQLGEWPLLLFIHGRLLREKCQNSSLAVALQFIFSALEEEGLDPFGEGNNRGTTLEGSMNVSLKHLFRDDDSDEKQRLKQHLYELAIFPSNAVIPQSTALKLWEATGGFAGPGSERRLDRIAGHFSRSKEAENGQSVLQFHDKIREYLETKLRESLKARNEDIHNLHQRFLDAYKESWDKLSDDDYIINHLIYHLEQAGREQEIHNLFHNQEWVKQRAKNSFIGLLNDFEKARGMVTPESDIATYLRYKLFADVVKQRYQKFPVAVLLVALEKGLASPERLLTDIASMDGDDEAKVRMYIEAYKVDVIPENLKKEFSAGILGIAARIHDDDKKIIIIILRDLIPALHDDIKPDAQQMLWQAIFEAREIGKNREVLNWLVKQLDNEQQLERLKQDAMQIDNIYRRTNIISLIAFRYSRSSQQDLWQNIYDSRLEGRSAYGRGKVFGYVVPRLPKDLQAKASSEILGVLFAISDETGDWDDPEFYSAMLQPLLPLVSSNDIPVLWERAKYEVQMRDSGWGTRPLIEFALLVSAENIPDDFHFDSEGAFDPVVEACVKWALAYRLPLEDQIQVAVDAWNVIWLYPLSVRPYARDIVSQFVEKLPQKVIVELWNATLALYQQEHDKKRAEGNFSDSFKRIDYPWKMLIALVPNLPADFIKTACMQCGDAYVRSVLGHNWLDVVTLLIESPEGKSIIWKDLLTRVLKEPVNYGYDKIDVKGAAKLIWLMPQTLQEESWGQVLNTIYSMTNPRTRTYDMVDMLEILPSYLKSKTWLDAWKIATGSNDKDLLLSVIDGFRYVYFYLSSELREVISKLDWMTSWWSDHLVTASSTSGFALRDDKQGYALFMQFAPNAFKVKVWDLMLARQSTDFNLYILATLFPIIPETDRSDVLKKIVYRSIGNKVDNSLQVIFSRWLAEDVWQVWECVYDAILVDSSLNWSAIEWTQFLTSFLSDTYCIRAWEKHVPKLTASDGFYEDIAVQLAKKLPVEYLPQAWQDVEQNAYYKRKIKSAMAPRLHVDFIRKLAQQDILLPQLPAQNIFTCSTAEYIRYGGPWLRLDKNSKTVVPAPFYELPYYAPNYLLEAAEQKSKEEYQQEIKQVLNAYSGIFYITIPMKFLIYFIITSWPFAIVVLFVWILLTIIGVLTIPIRKLFKSLFESIFEFEFKDKRGYATIRGSGMSDIPPKPRRKIRIPYDRYKKKYLLRKFKSFFIVRVMRLAFFETTSYNYFSLLFDKKAARSELVNAKDIVELANKRPLLQIVGGQELRKSVQESYVDAYGWWRDSLKREVNIKTL